jgi:hypothetical protein
VAVVHDQVTLVELAGRPEIEGLVVHDPVEDDAGVTERAVRDRDRVTAHDVVHDLVPHEDLEGISAGIPIDLECQDRLLGREPGIGQRR